MNYTHLKTAIAELTGTDEQVASMLNVKNVPSVQNIQVADMKQYLIVTGKILAIKASVDPAAMLTVEALNSFTEFVMSEPSNAMALNAQLDGLVTASLLTETDKTNILALGNTLTSIAEQNGLGVVRAGDVQYARSI